MQNKSLSPSLYPCLSAREAKLKKNYLYTPNPHITQSATSAYGIELFICHFEHFIINKSFWINKYVVTIFMFGTFFFVFTFWLALHSFKMMKNRVVSTRRVRSAPLSMYSCTDMGWMGERTRAYAKHLSLFRYTHWWIWIRTSFAEFYTAAAATSSSLRFSVMCVFFCLLPPKKLRL